MNAKDAIVAPKTFQTLLEMDRDDLETLYRKVLRVLRLRGSDVVSDNQNHVGTRLPLPEKTLLREVAAVKGSTVANEVRAAIREYFRRLDATIVAVAQMRMRKP